MSKLNQNGFTLVEAMIAIGIMGITAVGFMQIIGNQTQAKMSMESSFELSRKMLSLTYAFQSRDACINTFETTGVGDPIDKIIDGSKREILKKGSVEDFLEVTSMKLVNKSIPEPFVDDAQGEVTLVIEFTKKLKEDLVREKSISLQVKVDNTGKIKDCYSLDSSLKDTLCTELGGDLVDGKCEPKNTVLCENTLGEKGVKGSVSASYTGELKEYIRYYSSGRSTLFKAAPACGVGNVNDGSFMKCSGWNVLTGGCGKAGGSFPLTNDTWLTGQVCTRTQHGDNLEWCGKGGSDGSWGKYSCGQKLDDYIFDKKCDDRG